MSEESMYTNNETANNQIEPPATDADTVLTPLGTDASNIVPFTSEASEDSVTTNNSADKSPADKTPVVTPEPPSEFHGESNDLNEKAAAPTEKAKGFTAKTADFTEKAADLTGKAAEFMGKAVDYAEDTIKKPGSHFKKNEYDELADEDIPSKKHFHFKKGDKEFFRDKWILTRIKEENLMEYLALEQRRNELQQQAKDIKEKRFFRAFEITVALAAIVAVVSLLRNNPTILVNILYIAGITTAFWLWKKPGDK